MHSAYTEIDVGKVGRSFTSERKQSDAPRVLDRPADKFGAQNTLGRR